MNDARTAQEIGSHRPLRAQRREAGLVAQYIHELSERHGRARRARPALARRPSTAAEAGQARR
jgi:hypothetical protein